MKINKKNSDPDPDPTNDEQKVVNSYLFEVADTNELKLSLREIYRKMCVNLLMSNLPTL